MFHWFDAFPDSGSYLAGVWVPSRSGAITHVWVHRRVAGTGGNTVLDVNNSGSTIFTNQANRPIISAATGNNAVVQSGTIDSPLFNAGDWIGIQLDDKEYGQPKDLSITLEVRY
jgi:hypothetical protein